MSADRTQAAVSSKSRVARRRAFRQAFDRLEDRRLMATFAVTNANESGAGSLRAAITSANATPAADVISFNIAGGGVKTINLLNVLTIDQPVTIDATTQPGYAGAPLVRVRNGASVNNGIQVNAANSVVRGLSLTEFSIGITVDQPNVTIRNCYIGLDPTGAAAGNSNDGILVNASANYVVIRDNVISGNGLNGVKLAAQFTVPGSPVTDSAENAIFTGNIIGLDPTGLLVRANGQNGIRLEGGNSVSIGDAGDANRNIISGNALSGVRFSMASSNGQIVNNYFGLDKTGNVKLGNGGSSIVADGAMSLDIGFPGLGNRFGGNAIDLSNSIGNTITENVIGVGVNPAINLGGSGGMSITGNLNSVSNNVVGHMSRGVDLEGSNNTLTGNYVGTLPDGRVAGGSVGVFVTGSGNTLIGNRIAHFSAYGVNVVSGANNTFDNSTFANGQSYYFEAGQNDNLASPTITNISENPSGNYSTNVVFSVPAGSYRVSIYTSDTAGSANGGHTQRLLQTATFTSTGAAATRAYTLPGAGLDTKFLTATLTEMIGANSLGSTSIPSPASIIRGTPNLDVGVFEYEGGHVFKFDFTSVSSASVIPSDLVLRDTATMETYSSNTVANFADGYRFIRNAPLPDGNYEAVIPVGAVSNPYGSNRLAMSFNFHVLAGDANRDGAVDFDDLLILASNYNTTGKTFSQGNFNYDGGGNVNFDDLLILAAKYNTTLAAAASPLVAPGNVDGNDDAGSVGDDVLA